MSNTTSNLIFLVTDETALPNLWPFIEIYVIYFATDKNTPHKKMKFSIKELFSKCDQIRGFLPIWSHLLKKPLMKNFIFLWSEYFCWLKIAGGKRQHCP